MPNDIPTQTDCPQCYGTGKRNGEVCDSCNGTGKIAVTHYPPDTNPYKEPDTISYKEPDTNPHKPYKESLEGTLTETLTEPDENSQILPNAI